MLLTADVITTVACLVEEREEPRYFRSDSGPKLGATVLKRCLKAPGVGTLYVEPGRPWENAYAKAYRGAFRA